MPHHGNLSTIWLVFPLGTINFILLLAMLEKAIAIRKYQTLSNTFKWSAGMLLIGGGGGGGVGPTWSNPLQPGLWCLRQQPLFQMAMLSEDHRVRFTTPNSPGTVKSGTWNDKLRTATHFLHPCDHVLWALSSEEPKFKSTIPLLVMLCE